MAFVSSFPIISTPRSSLATRRLSLCMSVEPSTANKSDVAGTKAWDLTLISPSKINIFLRIVRKRPDGFHDLASLFQSISLHDKLYFSEKSSSASEPHKDTLECNIAGIPTDSSNLILKAISNYRQHTNIQKYYHVRVEKRIPHQAGLGGGSSNAATTLWAMNELNRRLCSTPELIEFGAEFGSDISFFFSNGTAYCTGRGEIIRNMQLPMDHQFRNMKCYIIKPLEGLSTKLVFQKFSIDDCSPLDALTMLNDFQLENDSCTLNLQALKPNFINDLESPSFQIMPSLLRLKEKLYNAGFQIVLMSGSGTSIFCLGEPVGFDFSHFQSSFSVENNVRVFEANFINRPSSESWYE